jgi:hypothetical protein
MTRVGMGTGLTSLNSPPYLTSLLASNSIFMRDISCGKRVFIKPPWKLAGKVGQHFQDCRRIAPESIPASFVLAKFNTFTDKLKLHKKR